MYVCVYLRAVATQHLRHVLHGTTAVSPVASYAASVSAAALAHSASKCSYPAHKALHEPGRPDFSQDGGHKSAALA